MEPERAGSPDRAVEQAREFARLVGVIQRQAIARCGVTPGQCFVLGEIGRSGPLNLKRLAYNLGLDPGWVSRAVERLVRAGLIHRQANPADRREVRLQLTAAGEAANGRTQTLLNAQMARILAAAPPAYRGALAEVFAALVRECRQVRAELQ